MKVCRPFWINCKLKRYAQPSVYSLPNTLEKFQIAYFSVVGSVPCGGKSSGYIPLSVTKSLVKLEKNSPNADKFQPGDPKIKSSPEKVIYAILPLNGIVTAIGGS